MEGSSSSVDKKLENASECPESEKVVVLVKGISDVPFVLRRSFTIRRLKRLYTKRVGGSSNLLFSYKGVIIKNEDTLKSLGIVDNDEILSFVNGEDRRDVKDDESDEEDGDNKHEEGEKVPPKKMKFETEKQEIIKIKQEPFDDFGEEGLVKVKEEPFDDSGEEGLVKVKEEPFDDYGEIEDNEDNQYGEAALDYNFGGKVKEEPFDDLGEEGLVKVKEEPFDDLGEEGLVKYKEE